MNYKIFSKVEVILKSLYGWIVLVPLSMIVPKKKNLVLFYSNQFNDNIKYMFIYTHLHRSSHNIEYYFLTKNKQLVAELREAQVPVLFFPSFKTYLKIIRAKILFVDNLDWIYNKRFYLLFRSYKVQLWHGVGLKQIEKDIYLKGFWHKLEDSLIGRFPMYNLLLSTSRFFTDHFFKSAFNVEKIVEFGYPRNDPFFSMDKINEIYIGSDSQTINRVEQLKKKYGFKVVLYAPTFRDAGGNAIEEDIIDLKTLTKYAAKNGHIWIFKFHPSMDLNINLESGSNIIIYDSHKDIYPLLPVTDLLITDYSSIYMDYLLLDKPVVFFPYDLQRYIKRDRGLKFDYNWITPGPKCTTQLELEEAVLKILKEEAPEFKRKRKELLDLAFEYQDGNSSARIWQYIKDEIL